MNLLYLWKRQFGIFIKTALFKELLVYIDSVFYKNIDVNRELDNKKMD